MNKLIILLFCICLVSGFFRWFKPESTPSPDIVNVLNSVPENSMRTMAFVSNDDMAMSASDTSEFEQAWLGEPSWEALAQEMRRLYFQIKASVKRERQQREEAIHEYLNSSTY